MHSHRSWKGRGLLAALGLVVSGCSQQPTAPAAHPASPREHVSEPQATPLITSTFQSELSLSAGSRVTFRVMASDPQARALTISWAANTGTLEAPMSEPTQSEVEWTPPPCVLTGTTPSITATVTNALGLSDSATFTLMGATTCLARGELPGSPRMLPLRPEPVEWSSR